MSFRALAVASFVLLASISSGAQTAVTMQFDVASVKENKSGMPFAGGERPTSNFPIGPGAMYSPTHGVFSAHNQPLLLYIMFAYKLPDADVGTLRKNMPAWALEAQYDIEAKTEKIDATKDEMRRMMQSLLADRFKLAVHTTSEEAPVYALVLAKPGKLGPGLRPHPADDTSCSNLTSAAVLPQDAPSAKAPASVAGGFPAICGGMAMVPPQVPGRMAFGYRNVPLSLVAKQLVGAGMLDRPVVDETGLTGNYDFLLEYSPEVPAGMTPPPGFDASGPPFRQALTEQTGLKLVPQRAMQERMVLDHIERPTAN